MSNANDLSTNRSSPVVDYTSVDFDGMKADLISYAQSKFSDRWTDFNDDQFAVVFVDLESYLHDLLHYNMNAIIREAFAATLLRRQNLINYGKMLDFAPSNPASSTVEILATLDAGGAYPFTILPSDTLFSNGNTEGDEIFFVPQNSQVVSAYNAAGVTIPCIEGELFTNQLIGVSTGAANQRWQFPQDGVVDNSISIIVGAETWSRVTNLTQSKSTDKHYKIVFDDEGHVFALFGDGVFGAIPSTSAQIRSTFRVGGGTRGNLNPQTITTKIAGNAAILSVTNPVKSSGGDNAQSMKSARNAIPATFKTLDRAVTTEDYADLAAKVSGVAKTRAAPGLPIGSRTVKLIIAPTGGGQPTSFLKSSVLSTFKLKKMVTNKVRAFGPIYKQIRAHFLLHVNPTFKAGDVNQQVRAGILNTAGSGLLNFAQLDFGAIGKDANGNPELLLAQTRLQGYFDRLGNIGLDRAEVLRLDVVPQARARDEGNSGSGSIADASILVTGKQRRREFFVQLTSATTYVVYERIIGFVSGLTDTTLSDDTKVFENEGIASYAGFRLNPVRGSSTEAVVTSAAGQNIVVSSQTSLFALTEVGAEYYLYDPNGVLLNVGDTFSSVDGSVRFTLTAGGSPFLNGDAFSVDVFPDISDIRLRSDEYPELLDANFTTRTSGGARV